VTNPLNVEVSRKLKDWFILNKRAEEIKAKAELAKQPICSVFDYDYGKNYYILI
jgi:hypothetical protein